MKYSGKYSLKRYLLREQKSARTQAGVDGQYRVARALLDNAPGKYYAIVIKTGSQATDLTILDAANPGQAVARLEAKSNAAHLVPMELSVYKNLAAALGYVTGTRGTKLLPNHQKAGEQVPPELEIFVDQMANDPGGNREGPILNDKPAQKGRQHKLFYILYDENKHSGMEDLNRLGHRSVRGNGKFGHDRPPSTWLIDRKEGGTKGELTKSCPTGHIYRANHMRKILGI